MSFLTALAYAAGGYGKGRQQRFQDQQAVTAQQTQADENRQAEADRQAQLAETKSYNAADLAQRQKQLEAQNRRDGLDANGNPIPLPGYAAPAPLPVGVKGAPATPDQMVRYYSDQARIATDNFARTGDQRWADVATRANTQAATFASATTNAARGTEIIEGKIPLDQANAANARARTAYVNSWRDRLKAQYDQQMRLEQARGSNRLSVAYEQAKAAMSRTQYATQYNADSREAIALQAAINASTTKGTAQDLQVGLAKSKADFDAAMHAYDAGSKIAIANGQPLPPTPQYIPPVQGATTNVFSPTIEVRSDGKGGFTQHVLTPPRVPQTPVDRSKPPADPRWPAIEQRYRAADAAGKAAILASPVLAGIPGGKEWLQKAAAPIAPLPVRPNLTVPGSTSIRG